MKSVMQHSFSRVQGPQIQRSLFRRLSTHKTTFDPGILIPLFVDEILPGDTVTAKVSLFARIQTMFRPIMDNVFMDVHWWFEPARLLWKNWEKFQGAQDDPDDSIDFTIPILALGEGAEFAASTIYDYMGMPTAVNMFGMQISALPYRMYNHVWNEWYRDQNLQAKVDFLTDDGPDPALTYTLLRRGKRHDYITSCLPFPQKGDNVPLPLLGTAPVRGSGLALGLTNGEVAGTVNFGMRVVAGTNELAGYEQVYTTFVGDTPAVSGNLGTNLGSIGVVENPDESGLIADLALTNAGLTIAGLRDAITLQQYLERDARGGTRYREIIKTRFGTEIGDARLARPEYLGGGTAKVYVKQVAQTAPSEDGTPQANLAAYAESGMENGFHHSFPEHGYLMCLVSVRSDIVYQQALRRMWTRRTRYDFYDPIFAHLGEQPVLKYEAHYDGPSTANEVFGYQERWAEYRYLPSMVTGAFRSNYVGTLHSWHLALDPSGPDAPVLDGTWIQDSPPLARVVAVENEDKVLLDSLFDIKHLRCIPIYSIPGLRRF